MRGRRAVEHLQLSEQAWTPTPGDSGVKRITLSFDEESGGGTEAIFTPAGFQGAQSPRFATADQDVFIYEGDYGYEPSRPLVSGDYLHRPPGTVYGLAERSTNSAIQIVSRAQQSATVRVLDTPEPWPGEYLIDSAWNRRTQQPMVVRSSGMPWQRSPIGYGVQEKRLRGEPGTDAGTPESGESWFADAVFLLRLPAGYRGPFPEWEHNLVEFLGVSGDATIDGRPWQRGTYAFGYLQGECSVQQDLVLYGRTFIINRY